MLQKATPAAGNLLRMLSFRLGISQCLDIRRWSRRPRSRKQIDLPTPTPKTNRAFEKLPLPRNNPKIAGTADQRIKFMHGVSTQEATEWPHS